MGGRQFHQVIDLSYGIRRFSAAFAIPILSIIHPGLRSDTYSFRIILILSSNLRLGLPKDLFPVGLPVKILKAFLLSPIVAKWPAHLYLLHLITLTIRWTVQTMNFLMCSLLHSSFFFLFGLNIRLRSLFLHTLSDLFYIK